VFADDFDVSLPGEGQSRDVKEISKGSMELWNDWEGS